jgi:hypothetical protein
MSEHFSYQYDFRFAPMWLSAGVLPWRDGVTITDDDRLVATFGIFRVDTPLHNIADAHVTEGYRWWTAIGPPPILRRRRTHVRNQPPRRNLHPLPQQNSSSPRSSRPLRPHRHRRRPCGARIHPHPTDRPRPELAESVTRVGVDMPTRSPALATSSTQSSEMSMRG